MNKLFKSVKVGKARKNVFDLSHEKKLTMNFGTLVPVFLAETLPNENWRISSEHVLRLAPMVAPVMHRMNAYIHYFFVPNRLIWDNWQEFITGGREGTTTVSTIPKINIDEGTKHLFGKGSMADYFGIVPVDGFASIDYPQGLNALPFRAYAQVFNDYYNDLNMSPGIPFTKGDTVVSVAEATELMTLRNRGYEKDYFTSLLPWTQRGEDVNIPIDPVYKLPAQANIAGGTPAQGAMTVATGDIQANSTSVEIDNIESLNATINDLRTSIRLQEWLEKNARAGSRYIEQILAHFGVRTPDYRLQRAEYLGGGKTPIQISEVLANFGSATIPQGNMSGHGLAVGANAGCKYKTYEHGWILGLMSILPASGYQQGIPRQFFKSSKFDFAFPEFANLGEQAVLSKEIYFDPMDSGNDNLFGYTPRFSEYKYIPNSVHGDFRDDLDFWHLGRIFSARPALNSSFIKCTHDDRIFAVDDLGATHKVYVQLYNNVRAIRPLPVYGTPML